MDQSRIPIEFIFPEVIALKLACSGWCHAIWVSWSLLTDQQFS